ncbi:dethiobiotin synthase [Spirosoma aureum]|uniref:ATP-dependent dethiobiotin synthetase BioD n=1 Tax=Spirosoma aureum TaxID=2692134 RepID=A0A6G9AH87_9BACT|nr:dethiobiotin synthase [Spirosoma aureum]QIP11821.1 dethiobiotin synthase [Spirosoma aureum]
MISAQLPAQFIIAGIGTEIGKTVVSAILVEALQADYWKPVQSGAADDSDTETVRQLISNPTTQFHPEAYRLSQPLSPHAAADLDGVHIDLNAITLPRTSNALVVELAGGLMVPLNEHELNIDLVQRLGLPIILVSRNYLGSINHTLLSIECCRSRNIPIAGIVFNGPTVTTSESFILTYTTIPCLGRIGQETSLTKDVIRHYANQFTELIGAR